MYSAYNSESSYPNCIFVFGGGSAGSTSRNEMYCYDVNDDTLTYWGGLDSTYKNYQMVYSAAFYWSTMTTSLFILALKRKSWIEARNNHMHRIRELLNLSC